MSTHKSVEGDSGTNDTAPETSVVSEQIKLLYHNPPDVPINLINACITCATLRQFYPTWVLAAWLVLFWLVNLVRLWMRHRFASESHTPETALLWGKFFALNAFATACLWGAVGSVLLMSPDPTYRLFVIFVLGGTMAGGIVSTAPYEPAMFAFLVPTVAPAIVCLAFAQGLVPIEMAAMLSLFTVALTLVGRSINRSIVQNFRLRIGQSVLLTKLRASETAMAEAQALAHVGSFQWDLKSRVFSGSVEAYRIFAFDPDSFVATYEAVFAHIHPSDRALVQQKIATAVATREGHEIYHRIVRDSGEIRYVHEITKVKCDAKGNPVTFIGTIEDITDRKQAEAAKARLAAIVDSSIDAIVSETADGTITSWNRSAEHLFGYSADEIIGKNIRILLPDGRNSETDENLLNVSLNKCIEPYDSERIRKDGTLIDVSIAISPILGIDGSPAGGSFIARDITERKHVELALAYQESLLHAVMVGTNILVRAQSIELRMPEALRVLGESMHVDRVLMMQGLQKEKSPPILRYIWQTKDIKHAFDLSTYQPSLDDIEALIEWRSPLTEGEALIAQRATSSGAIRALLEHFNVQSFLMVPVFVDKKLWGTLAVDSCSVTREWTTGEIETMKAFGEMAGALIVHNEAILSLQASEERFRVLTATAQDAIITTDKAGLINRWNLAAERILGYTAEEAIGKQVHRLLAPASHRNDPDLSMLAEGAETGKTIETTVVRKDGTEVVVELSVSGARLGGDWLGIGIMRDITDRKAAETKLQFANVLLKTEMEASPDGILVVDANRKIISFNQRFAEIWEIPNSVLAEGDDLVVFARVRSSVRSQVEFEARVNYLFDHPGEDGHDEFETIDGRYIDRYTGTLTTSDREHLGRVWFFRDITARKVAEDKLKFTNLLLKTQMEASQDGIYVVDVNRRVISFNQRLADIFKSPSTVLGIGNDFDVLAYGLELVKEPEKFAALVQRFYDHPKEVGQDEFEMKDGRMIDRYTLPLTTPSEENLGRVWFFRDVTESKRAAQLALRMARFDVLTGLANRSVFIEALNFEIARVQRGEKGFAVIYMDLDHFKDVNDTLGHPIGDALLQAVAERLKSNTRASDTVARFGGDEFAVVVADIAEPADVAILAEKLVHALSDPYSIQGNDIYSSASIGIDIYGPDARDAETLLSHADVALYRAKSEGRSGYRFFTDAMDADVRMQVALGTELHEALDAGQLFLLYQPQVAVEGGQIRGVEALVRWRHPKRGILGPDTFIPVAEKMGMIVKLGHWVLMTACQQAKAWSEAKITPIRTAVNLSGLQFKSPIALEADISAILTQTGLPPQLLELELTESVLMSASKEHRDIILRLRRIGVTIAIDDFGTGYSSLDYLRRFPADRIKIAQTFVEHLETMPGDAAIVRATLGLAHEMGIVVIAEGVETQEQYDLLKGWGCAEIQGFYFAAPMTAESVTLLLRSGGVLQPRAASAV